MLNLLEDYIHKSVPEGPFVTNPGLAQKVDATGTFQPYYGNTVVFRLDESTKCVLADLQRGLYRSAGALLAQPLDPTAFHMTLHDLVHGPVWTEAMKQCMAETEGKVQSLLVRWQSGPSLRMRTTWNFNLVHTSVVVGLAPLDRESECQLDNMYQALEEVVPLGYGLTPHITLAYYRPGVYSAEQADQLREALGPVALGVSLPMQNLVYQTFCDMNHYYETKERGTLGT